MMIVVTNNEQSFQKGQAPYATFFAPVPSPPPAPFARRPPSTRIRAGPANARARPFSTGCRRRGAPRPRPPCRPSGHVRPRVVWVKAVVGFLPVVGPRCRSRGLAASLRAQVRPSRPATHARSTPAPLATLPTRLAAAVDGYTQPPTWPVSPARTARLRPGQRLISDGAHRTRPASLAVPSDAGSGHPTGHEQAACPPSPAPTGHERALPNPLSPAGTHLPAHTRPRVAWAGRHIAQGPPAPPPPSPHDRARGARNPRQALLPLRWVDWGSGCWF